MSKIISTRFFLVLISAIMSNYLNAAMQDSPNAAIEAKRNHEFLFYELLRDIENPKDLVWSINQVLKQYSLEMTINLLKEVLSQKGLSLSSMKGNDDNTILHYACRDQASFEIIKIILQVSASEASTLVCTENFWGQTALYFAVRNIKDHDGRSLDIIYALLNAAPGKEWDLINKKTLRHLCGGDHSVLSYAEINGEKNNVYTKKLIQHLKTYKPKNT